MLDLSKALRSESLLVVGSLLLATALCLVPLLSPFLP